jgi:hypothetical protein
LSLLSRTVISELETTLNSLGLDEVKAQERTAR